MEEDVESSGLLTSKNNSGGFQNNQAHIRAVTSAWEDSWRRSRHHLIYWAVILILGWAVLHLSTPDAGAEFVRNPQPTCDDHSFFPNSICGVPPADLSKIQMSDVCGSWQAGYIAKHKRDRERLGELVKQGLMHETGRLVEDWRKHIREEENPRITIFHCVRENNDHGCGGFGDTLLGLTTFFFHALLTDRSFFIHWPVGAASLQPGEIDWTLPRGYIVPQYNPHSARDVEDWVGDDVVLLSYLNHYPSLDELRQTIDEKGARVVVVRYNHGSVIEWLQQNATIGAHLGLKPPFAWGCLNRFLIKPKLLVTEPFRDLAAQLEHPETFSVCVHARLEDDDMNGRKRSDAELDRLLSPYLHCAESLKSYWASSACKATRIFLMSSSYELKQFAQEQYPEVLITPVRPIHVDMLERDDASMSILKAMATTVAEWDLFSRCKFYIFEQSGLSTTASARGMKPLRMFVFPRGIGGDDNQAQQHCVAWHPSSRPDVASQWSGL